MSDSGYIDPVDITPEVQLDSGGGDIPWADNLGPVDMSTTDPYSGPMSAYDPTWATGGTTSDSSSFDPVKLAQLLQSGVDTYGKILAIQHGGYQAYNVGPGQGVPPPPNSEAYSQHTGAPAPAAPSGSFDFRKLTDFSTVYPYAAAVVGLLGVAIVIRVARG